MNNLYSNIYTLDGNSYSIFSKNGKNILRKYIKSFKKGGDYIESGANKCFFRPSLQCADGRDTSNTVSALTEMPEARKEMFLSELVKNIDPEGEFTVTPIGNCGLKDTRLTDNKGKILFVHFRRYLTSQLFLFFENL